jgi:hypothetical protein
MDIERQELSQLDDPDVALKKSQQGYRYDEKIGKENDDNKCVVVFITICSIFLIIITFPFSLCFCIRMVQVDITLVH